MLAGVGTTWYTWLEQGRDVRPSNEFSRRLPELCVSIPPNFATSSSCTTGRRRNGVLQAWSGSMSRFAGCWTA